MQSMPQQDPSAPLRVTVTVITKDECPRLRLVLASLFAQTIRPGPHESGYELVVVNDGSSDDTRGLLDSLKLEGSCRVVHHPAPLGRSASRNRGGHLATGNVLVFIDGDTLAAPDFVQAHLEAHRQGAIMARGELWHIRSTRPFLDPIRGVPFPGQEQRVKQLEAELPRCLLSPEQVTRDFAAVAARAEPGLYPGTHPRRLADLEMSYLARHPDGPVSWMAAAGSNMSYRSDAFREAGGFDEQLTLNEHRELALRLTQRGRGVRAAATRSYHMTHRSGWRDPVGEDVSWRLAFSSRHTASTPARMCDFWRTVARDPRLPNEARIADLEAFDRVLNEPGSRPEYPVS